MQREGFYIEFHTVGNSVKVSAIDPRTGREVSIVGAKSASQQELSNLAVKKLIYVMNKDQAAK